MNKSFFSNLRKLLVALFLFGFLMIFISIGIYIYKFGSISLSNKKDDWDLFSTYINGIISPIIGLISLMVTTYIAYEFNNYQKLQQKIKDQDQLQQTTIELFKEWRNPSVLNARKLAWAVKRKWENKGNNSFKTIFIEAMVMEEPVESVSEAEFRAVYDLFAFFNMLSLYRSNEKNIRNLNYFSYPWWRPFLYEVAIAYDQEKLKYIFEKEETNQSLYKTFKANISLTNYLTRLDKVCGFADIDNPNENNIFRFYIGKFA